MVFKKKRGKSRSKSSSYRRKAKVKSRRSSRKSMSKKTSRRGKVSRGFGRIGSSLKTGMLGEAVKGAGAARLSHVVTDRLPQTQPYAPMIAVGAGFAAGGIIGGVAAAFTEGIIGSGLIGSPQNDGGQML